MSSEALADPGDPALVDDAPETTAARSARRRGGTWKLLLDVLLFATWVIAGIPRTTGTPIHEWVSLGVIVVIVVHLSMHGDWLWRNLSRLRVLGRAKVDRPINLVLWLLATVVMVSGLLISRVALPAVGLHPVGGGAWRELHSMSTTLFLVVLAWHVLSHWSWLVAHTKVLFGRSAR